jgi:hypothetical protein
LLARQGLYHLSHAPKPLNSRCIHDIFLLNQLRYILLLAIVSDEETNGSGKTGGRSSLLSPATTMNIPAVPPLSWGKEGCGEMGG